MHACRSRAGSGWRRQSPNEPARPSSTPHGSCSTSAATPGGGQRHHRGLRDIPGRLLHLFQDKREIFDILSERAYRDLREVLAGWSARCPRAARPTTYAGSSATTSSTWTGTVRSPWPGAFRSRRRRLPRGIPAHADPVSWILRQGCPVRARTRPEVVGSAVFGLLDRSWHTVRAQSVTVSEDEMVDLLTDMIVGMRG